MSILFFDTETTGLVKPDGTGLDLQPRIIELACMRTDLSGKTQASFRTLIDPERRIPIEATRINGISNVE